MALSKTWAAGVMAATTMVAGQEKAHARFDLPSTPPSINRESDKDHIPTLMLKLYDINQKKYDETLGMSNVQPKQVDDKTKIVIYDEITDEAKRKECCREFGVDEKQVKKITIKGDAVVKNYYFSSGQGDDGRDKIIATAAATLFEARPPAIAKQPVIDRTVRTFSTVHLPGEQKVIFGYKEVHPAEKKAAKWNVISVKYNREKHVFTTVHTDKKTSEEKELGTHSLKEVEQRSQLVPRAAGSSPGRP